MKKLKVKIVLDDKKIKSTLRIKEIIKVVEEGFKKKGLGLVNLPPKMGPKLDVPGAFSESMPVSVFKKKGKLEIFGIKWQSAYKSNLKKGIPYLNNLIILNEPDSGLPTAIVNGNFVTGIRTAAASAVSAKYLAPQKSKLTIGVFGLGLQAYLHVLAFKTIFKNPRFFLYEHDSKFLSDFRKKFPKERFITSKNYHEVVKNSDIVLSVTTFPPKISPYIFAKDLKDDVLILPVDYGTRIDPSLYNCLDEIYTDDAPQYELKSKLRQYFPSNRPKIKKEIGWVVAKRYKRKPRPRKILVFNLGIALFDILTAQNLMVKLKG